MKKLKPSKISLIIIGLIMVLATGLFVFFANKEKTYDFGLSIDNLYDYYPEISNNLRNQLFYNLYTLAGSQLEEGATIPESGALIREGTVEKTDKSFSSIVDIDTLRQSYFVVITPQDEENPIIFSCPTKDQIIYKNTFCEIHNIDEPIISTTFKHDYLIKNIFGSAKGEPILNFIRKVLNEKSEQLSAPEERSEKYSLEVVFDERSYTSTSRTIYNINFSTNDGRSYLIQINNQDIDNMAAYVTRTDIGGHSFAAVFSNNNNNTALISWIQSLSSDIEIDFRTL